MRDNDLALIELLRESRIVHQDADLADDRFLDRFFNAVDACAHIDTGGDDDMVTDSVGCPDNSSGGGDSPLGSDDEVVAVEPDIEAIGKIIDNGIGCTNQKPVRRARVELKALLAAFSKVRGERDDLTEMLEEAARRLVSFYEDHPYRSGDDTVESIVSELKDMDTWKKIRRIATPTDDATDAVEADSKGATDGDQGDGSEEGRASEASREFGALGRSKGSDEISSPRDDVRGVSDDDSDRENDSDSFNERHGRTNSGGETDKGSVATPLSKAREAMNDWVVECLPVKYRAALEVRLDLELFEADAEITKVKAERDVAVAEIDDCSENFQDAAGRMHILECHIAQIRTCGGWTDAGRTVVMEAYALATPTEDAPADDSPQKKRWIEGWKAPDDTAINHLCWGYSLDEAQTKKAHDVIRDVLVLIRQDSPIIDTIKTDWGDEDAPADEPPAFKTPTHHDPEVCPPKPKAPADEVDEALDDIEKAGWPGYAKLFRAELARLRGKADTQFLQHIKARAHLEHDIQKLKAENERLRKVRDAAKPFTGHVSELNTDEYQAIKDALRDALEEEGDG